MSKSNKDGHTEAADILIGYSQTGNVSGFAAGAGTTSKSDSVWTGGNGSTAYTVGDVVAALKKIGILAP